jgi:Co/Zn/Cd efflux system component
MTDFTNHNHVFLGEGHEKNERRTWMVIALCSLMMVAEIIGGLLFGSIALVADGLHMSTHASALLLAAVAYSYARRHADDERFTFGTGKLAVLGLIVNIASVLLLSGGGHYHGHSHGDSHAAHHHEHEHEHVRGAARRDNNMRAAVVHVLADAAVSVLVIVGLLFGRFLGWTWMEPRGRSLRSRRYRRMVLRPRARHRSGVARYEPRPRHGGTYAGYDRD